MVPFCAMEGWAASETSSSPPPGSPAACEAPVTLRQLDAFRLHSNTTSRRGVSKNRPDWDCALAGPASGAMNIPKMAGKINWLIRGVLDIALFLLRIDHEALLYRRHFR